MSVCVFEFIDGVLGVFFFDRDRVCEEFHGVVFEEDGGAFVVFVVLVLFDV